MSLGDEILSHVLPGFLSPAMRLQHLRVARNPDGFERNVDELESLLALQDDIVQHFDPLLSAPSNLSVPILDGGIAASYIHLAQHDTVDYRSQLDQIWNDFLDFVPRLEWSEWYQEVASWSDDPWFDEDDEKDFASCLEHINPNNTDAVNLSSFLRSMDYEVTWVGANGVDEAEILLHFVNGSVEGSLYIVGAFDEPIGPGSVD